jgi:deazaflavin-dependent oxidoreductase (nitroreductase family)
MGVNQWLERIYAASSTRPPKRLIRAVGALHRFAIVSTGGRFGRDLLNRPILLLTTTGCRTSKQRTQPLMYLQEADCYLVAASFGGHDQDPAWLTNIRTNPQATIVVEGREVPVFATIATPDERDRMWPRFPAFFAAYDKYQRATDRQIPIVKLRPTGADRAQISHRSRAEGSGPPSGHRAKTARLKTDLSGVPNRTSYEPTCQPSWPACYPIDRPVLGWSLSSEIC